MRGYGSIPHLPGSRTGPAERTVPAGLAQRLTVDAGPDAVVIVQEKLDGSCVMVARDGEGVVALGRAGDRAADSRNEGRRLWAQWVDAHRERLAAILRPGERLVGEWLALVHTTRYRLPHEPFVAFDLLVDDARVEVDTLRARVAPAGLVTPAEIHRGRACAVDDALTRMGAGQHGAIDPVEGAVWRLQRRRADGRPLVEVAKFVRPGKIDGARLPEATGRAPEWNWRPEGPS